MLMTTRPFLFLFAFMLSGIFADTAFSKIGETKATMIQVFGTPTDTTAEGFKVFKQGHLTIHAHFTEGNCDNIVYIAADNAPFDANITSEILAYESNGAAWIVSEKSTSDFTMWSTVKNKLHAALYTHSKLSIFTDAFLKSRMSKQGN